MSDELTYATGLAPDRGSTRERDMSECPWQPPAGYRSATAAKYIQPVAWIRHQRKYPSCAGQAPAAIIDAARGKPPWASAVSIWREARRRQGAIERIEWGTRFEYVIAGLVHRGWDEYVEGEDTDPIEASQQDDLADELFADDKRMGPTLERYRIDPDDLDALDAALLEKDLGVMIGTGTTDAYQRFKSDAAKPDTILDTTFMGGSRDGHGQRIFGRAAFDGRRVYYVQNSWGEWWGGCHLHDDSFQPGCCIVDESVVLAAWDLYALRPKK